MLGYIEIIKAVALCTGINGGSVSVIKAVAGFYIFIEPVVQSSINFQVFGIIINNIVLAIAGAVNRLCGQRPRILLGVSGRNTKGIANRLNEALAESQQSNIKGAVITVKMDAIITGVNIQLALDVTVFIAVINAAPVFCLFIGEVNFESKFVIECFGIAYGGVIQRLWICRFSQLFFAVEVIHPCFGHDAKALVVKRILAGHKEDAVKSIGTVER